MPTLSDRITELLKQHPGLSDREITDKLVRPGALQQPINQACRGAIFRRKRPDGRIGNYLVNGNIAVHPTHYAESREQNDDVLSEDAIKRALLDWLRSQGWTTTVAWARIPGIDIEARRGVERWIIEVKGRGSRPQMRVNYFLAVLGELLQRMDDPNARYSIALPDVPQFRGLWQRLPALAKSRTGITVLLVDEGGNVKEWA